MLSYVCIKRYTTSYYSTQFVKMYLRREQYKITYCGKTIKLWSMTNARRLFYTFSQLCHIELRMQPKFLRVALFLDVEWFGLFFALNFCTAYTTWTDFKITYRRVVNDSQVYSNNQDFIVQEIHSYYFGARFVFLSNGWKLISAKIYVCSVRPPLKKCFIIVLNMLFFLCCLVTY